MENKKVVIVTGAARGIGRAIAWKYAAGGYAVAGVDRDAEGLSRLKMDLEKLKYDFFPITGNLEEDAFMNSITLKVRARWGRIDVLVNNAVSRTLETMRSISLADWERTFRICLTVPAFLARQTAAVMEEKGIAGVIINISSVMSQRAGGNSPAYIAAKGGLESLTYELAVLYGPKNIRVIAVNPGNIQTSLGDDYVDGDGNNISSRLSDHMDDNTPLRRKGTPEEIANITYWLSSGEASFITGTTILADGGFFHNFNAYEMKKIQFPGEF